ncbi:aspartyl protease family protein [Salix suchowensis]|nr:aspartyl protease family protein [Salix suchowensis]
MVRAEPFFPEKLFLVFSILAIFDNGVQCFQGKKVLGMHKFQWKQESNSSTCLSQKTRWENGATILEMKHKDSCSGKILDWDKKLQKHLIMDDFQLRSLQSRMKSIISGRNIDDSVDSTLIPLTSGIRIQTLNYIVTLELGGRKMTVIVDTGSDLSWVQCQPCKRCYNQQDPVFNPSTSPSYQTVLCSSPACQSLEFATGNSGVCGSNPPTCNYVVNYGDGSYTRGELSMEHLNLGSSTTVNNFIFGCGRNNQGLFGGASGLVGLGRSSLSLISQTSAMFGGVFSYCLPITEAESSGSLIMGGNSSVYKNTTPISYTRMIPNPLLPFYFLNLTGITVGSVAVQAPSFGKGGMMIDSGTVISRLPPSIYQALKGEFVKQFSGFPSAPAFMILDTCFNLSGYQEVEIPNIKMHFEGNAELNVDVTGVFYFVKTDASQVCLAVASLSYENEVGIIGNYQQKNQRVIYDIKGSMLGFAAEACSFD